jgi:hypothetical protein
MRRMTAWGPTVVVVVLLAGCGGAGVPAGSDEAAVTVDEAVGRSADSDVGVDDRGAFPEGVHRVGRTTDDLVAAGIDRRPPTTRGVLTARFDGGRLVGDDVNEHTGERVEVEGVLRRGWPRAAWVGRPRGSSHLRGECGVRVRRR